MHLGELMSSTLERAEEAIAYGRDESSSARMTPYNLNASVTPSR
jgi:hypothetical protein